MNDFPTYPDPYYPHTRVRVLLEAGLPLLVFLDVDEGPGRRMVWAPMGEHCLAQGDYLALLPDANPELARTALDHYGRCYPRDAASA